MLLFQQADICRLFVFDRASCLKMLALVLAIIMNVEKKRLCIASSVIVKFPHKSKNYSHIYLVAPEIICFVN